MTDSVKFIFKTLIKVPVIIMVSFFIFNLFAFGLTYFRLLGFSYVVMQTAVENNYLPKAELDTLNKYLEHIANTAVVENAFIVIKDENDDAILPATERRQYGMPITVGVSADFRFIWPLTPRDQLQDPSSGFVGLDRDGNQAFSGFADANTLESRREGSWNTIRIIYTVPGLRYYPDLN